MVTPNDSHQNTLQKTCRLVVCKWAAWGVLFGGGFPIASMAMLYFLEGLSPAESQRLPLLWVIDTAPLVLGVAFGLVGRAQSKLLALNSSLEATIQERTLTIQANAAKLMNSAKMASLGEMAGGVAHEINNPLAIILGKVQQIRRKLENKTFDPAEATVSFAKIEDTVNRIARIIRGLRAFSRNSESDPVAPVRTSLLVENCLELVREKIKHAGVRLDVQTPATDFAVLGREPQLAQVIVNLLGNALDAVASTPDPWIKLSIEPIGQSLRFRVIDSGAGIPKEILDKLMQPFFTTKGVGKGTGLGLSISRGIIADHGGGLEYVLLDGHTCFQFQLRRASMESPVSLSA